MEKDEAKKEVITVSLVDSVRIEGRGEEGRNHRVLLGQLDRSMRMEKDEEKEGRNHRRYDSIKSYMTKA